MTERRPVVLVVDDDLLVLATIAMQIRRAGFSPMEAHSGEEALRRFRELRPDAALVDFALPGMSGLQLIAELHRLADIPCVVLTGSDDAGSAAARAGAIGCLVKPVDTTRLGEVLRLALESRTN
jgi:CheY-like chemotaxis protein